MNPMMASLIRHALTLGAGYLVGKGYIDSSMANEVVGGVMSVGAVGWSFFEKRSK